MTIETLHNLSRIWAKPPLEPLHFANLCADLRDDSFHSRVRIRIVSAANELGKFNIEFWVQPIKGSSRSFESGFQARSGCSESRTQKNGKQHLILFPGFSPTFGRVWGYLGPNGTPQCEFMDKQLRTNQWWRIFLDACLESDRSPSLPPSWWRRRAPPSEKSNGWTGRLLLVMFNASARKYSGINTSYQKLLHFWNNSYCDFPLVQILVGRIDDY